MWARDMEKRVGSEQSLGKEGVPSWKPPLLATGSLPEPGVTPKPLFPIGIPARWAGGRNSRKGWVCLWCLLILTDSVSFSKG